jgi:hypothetical protein
LKVVNFEQTHPNNSPQIPGLLIRLGDYGKSEELKVQTTRALRRALHVPNDCGN